MSTATVVKENLTSASVRSEIRDDMSANGRDDFKERGAGVYYGSVDRSRLAPQLATAQAAVDALDLLPDGPFFGVAIGCLFVLRDHAGELSYYLMMQPDFSACITEMVEDVAITCISPSSTVGKEVVFRSVGQKAHVTFKRREQVCEETYEVIKVFRR